MFTEGSYQCGKCEEQFATREEVLKHMDEKHDKTMTAKAKPNDKPGKDNQGQVKISGKSGYRGGGAGFSRGDGGP